MHRSCGFSCNTPKVSIRWMCSRNMKPSISALAVSVNRDCMKRQTSSLAISRHIFGLTAVYEIRPSWPALHISGVYRLLQRFNNRPDVRRGGALLDEVDLFVCGLPVFKFCKLFSIFSSTKNYRAISSDNFQDFFFACQ